MASSQRGAESSKVPGIPSGSALHLFPGPKRRLVPCRAIRGGRRVRARRIPRPTCCGGWRDRSAIRPACHGGQRDWSAVGHANVECPPSKQRKFRQRTIPRRIWSALPVRRIKSEQAIGTRKQKRERGPHLGVYATARRRSQQRFLARVHGAEIADGSWPFLPAGAIVTNVLGAEIAGGSRLFPQAGAVLARVLGAVIVDGSWTFLPSRALSSPGSAPRLPARGSRSPRRALSSPASLAPKSPTGAGGSPARTRSSYHVLRRPAENRK